jgi:hypothetical protein
MKYAVEMGSGAMSLLFILTANGPLPSGSDTTITHHAQTKHSTQNYTHNKGHTTHNVYNANTITTTVI